VFIGHAVDKRSESCLLRRIVKKPRGHYTARPSTRLPISRFRRFTLLLIDENQNGCVQTRQSWNVMTRSARLEIEGMAMRERDR
jgi:hypothetical protein